MASVNRAKMREAREFAVFVPLFLICALGGALLGPILGVPLAYAWLTDAAWPGRLYNRNDNLGALGQIAFCGAAVGTGMYLILGVMIAIAWAVG